MKAFIAGIFLIAGSAVYSQSFDLGYTRSRVAKVQALFSVPSANGKIYIASKPNSVRYQFAITINCNQFNKSWPSSLLLYRISDSFNRDFAIESLKNLNSQKATKINFDDSYSCFEMSEMLNSLPNINNSLLLQNFKKKDYRETITLEIAENNDGKTNLDFYKSIDLLVPQKVSLIAKENRGNLTHFHQENSQSDLVMEISCGEIKNTVNYVLFHQRELKTQQELAPTRKFYFTDNDNTDEGACRRLELFLNQLPNLSTMIPSTSQATMDAASRKPIILTFEQNKIVSIQAHGYSSINELDFE